MSRRVLIPLAILGSIASLPFLLGTNPLAAANADCCEVDCSHCGRAFCYPVPKEVTVSKNCWEVELKQVCIPAVRFPWERWFGGGCDGCTDGCNSCRPRCGRVRWVRVLKKRKYDCKKCGCDWIINPVCDDCVNSYPLHAEPLEDVPPPPTAVEPPGDSSPIPTPAPTTSGLGFGPLR